MGYQPFFMKIIYITKTSLFNVQHRYIVCPCKYVSFLQHKIYYVVFFLLLILLHLLLACLSGYYGPNCTLPCRFPNYGTECQLKCDCDEQQCNHTIGCRSANILSFHFPFFYIFFYFWIVANSNHFENYVVLAFDFIQ